MMADFPFAAELFFFYNNKNKINRNMNEIESKVTVQLNLATNTETCGRHEFAFMAFCY